VARDVFIGRRKRHPGDAWVERGRRAQLLHQAIQMRDSGALSEEEFASLSSLLLEGRPMPEVADEAEADMAEADMDVETDQAVKSSEIGR
jgi:hypothetical protein